MSVIAHVKTPDGFVVAADGPGLPVDSNGSTVRKALVRLVAPAVNLVSGWTGVTRIPCEEGTFDLIAQTELIGDMLSSEQSGAAFISKLFEELRSRFDDELRIVFRSGSSKGLFVGYVRNESSGKWEPACWVWNLKNDGDPEQRPTVDGYQITAGPSDLFSGLRLPKPATLQDGEDGLRLYVETCLKEPSERGGKLQIVTLPQPLD